MNWLQNAIIIIITFLLARILIDADIHRELVARLVIRSHSDLSSLVSALLLISYTLSLFFSNTIVVLAMIPIVRYILSQIDKSHRRSVSSSLILALIYGANIGGMGSLIGSPANILYVGFIELNQIPGREKITFFSWLLIGIPATLVLLLLARWVLRWGEKRNFEISLSHPAPGADDRRRSRRYLIFFLANILFIILLSATQFMLMPPPLAAGLNIIDWLLLLYLAAFIFFAFFYPRDGFSLHGLRLNLLYAALFMACLPLIWLSETWRDIRSRLPGAREDMETRLSRWVGTKLKAAWYHLSGETLNDIRTQGRTVHISLNRLIYDLPFFGLLFMAVVILGIYFLLTIGNNPATPGLDGYLYQYLDHIATRIIPVGGAVLLFLTAVVMVSIFITEIINNTTVVFILFPIILQIGRTGAFNPLFLLMAVSIASTGAFMTPLATSVNAIAYASIPGISLKRMLSRGFLINILSGLWIALTFFILIRAAS